MSGKENIMKRAENMFIIPGGLKIYETELRPAVFSIGRDEGEM